MMTMKWEVIFGLRIKKVTMRRHCVGPIDARAICGNIFFREGLLFFILEGNRMKLPLKIGRVRQRRLHGTKSSRFVAGSLHHPVDRVALFSLAESCAAVLVLAARISDLSL